MRSLAATVGTRESIREIRVEFCPAIAYLRQISAVGR
jgi:hypothetical protein